MAIRPSDDVFLMSFLHYPDEVRKVSDIDDLPAAREPNAAETAMARQLLDSYARPFDLSDFEDSYRKRFLEIVEAKSRGEELVTAPSVEPRRVINLMDALKSSLARIEAEELGDPDPASGEERRAS